MKRKLRLTVGNTNTSDGFVVENLKVNFEVQKLPTGAMNTATIQIWNLSNRHRLQLQNEYTKCILEYGNNSFLTVLFIGQIYNSITTKDSGVDTITTLYCGSGLNAFKNATVHKSFPAGTALRDLVGNITDELQGYGITLGLFDKGLENVSESRGQVVSGAVSNVLDNLLQGTGFTWSLNDDNIEVRKLKTESKTDIYITPANGLIGSAKRTQIGFDFTCILNPQLLPGETVGVYSEFADTAEQALHFRKVKPNSGSLVHILNLIHTGGNFDGTATTSIVGRT